MKFRFLATLFLVFFIGLLIGVFGSLWHSITVVLFGYSLWSGLILSLLFCFTCQVFIISLTRQAGFALFSGVVAFFVVSLAATAIGGQSVLIGNTLQGYLLVFGIPAVTLLSMVLVTKFLEK